MVESGGSRFNPDSSSVYKQEPPHVEDYYLLGVAEAQVKELEEENKKLIENERTNTLTGLPNKKALEEFISIFDSRPYDIIVTYIDLKNFGEINLLIGHAKADEKVYEFGQYLKDEIRQSDLLFHPHGDEFILLSSKRNKTGGEISPEKGLRRHLENINEGSKTKFDFFSVTFDKNKHPSLSSAVNEADNRLMEIKKARKQKSQQNLD